MTTPAVGSKVRITRTHESGAAVSILAVVELVHTEDLGDGPETCVAFVDNIHVRLTGRRGWTVTWEEVEPPQPELPPLPEPGYYLDSDGDFWRVVADKGHIEDTHGGPWDWKDAHGYGPFTRLVPASEVVDADLARRLADELEIASRGEHNAGIKDSPFDRCEGTACRIRRELVAEARAQIGGQ